MTDGTAPNCEIMSGCTEGQLNHIRSTLMEAGVKMPIQGGAGITALAWTESALMAAFVQYGPTVARAIAALIEQKLLKPVPVPAETST